MDDLLKDFLIESNEGVEKLDDLMVRLETESDNPEIIQEIFRVIHTIKGTCGFHDLGRLEALSHVGEDLLDRLRKNKLKLNSSICDVLLRTNDRLKFILKRLEMNEKEPTGEDTDLIDEIKSLMNDDSDSIKSVSGSSPSDIIDESSSITEPENIQTEKSSETSLINKPESTSQNEDSESTSEKGVTNQSLRVDVQILDKLMTRVGELVLVRNQLTQMLQSEENSRFFNSILELDRVTSELQKTSCKPACGKSVMPGKNSLESLEIYKPKPEKNLI